MARYMSVIMASIEARLRTANNRLKKVTTIAKFLLFNQLASKKVCIMWVIGKLMAELSKSTRARFAMKTFGTVRNDLNRAMSKSTIPLPSKQIEVRRDVNMLVITFVKSDIAGYMASKKIFFGSTV